MKKPIHCISLAFLMSAFGAMTANAEDITLKGSDAFQARQKATCGTTKPAVLRYGFFEGRLYSRVPGEKDTHIFNVMGINVRHCAVVQDSKKGKGFRSVSREIMVYLDPETNKIVDKWKNPWTGEMIDVMHVANDPVNMRDFVFEKDKDSKRPMEFKVRRYGDVAVTSNEVPLFYDNPLGSDYQQYVGGKYHAMEIFNSFYDAEKLINTEIDSIDRNELAWARVAQWLPWLKMGDKSGLMIFNASGFSTLDKADLPDNILRIMDKRYPLYHMPPPLDDDRKNETSWTVFKKKLEEK